MKTKWERTDSSGEGNKREDELEHIRIHDLLRLDHLHHFCCRWSQPFAVSPAGRPELV